MINLTSWKDFTVYKAPLHPPCLLILSKSFKCVYCLVLNVFKEKLTAFSQSSSLLATYLLCSPKQPHSRLVQCPLPTTAEAGLDLQDSPDCILLGGLRPRTPKEPWLGGTRGSFSPFQLTSRHQEPTFSVTQAQGPLQGLGTSRSAV